MVQSGDIIIDRDRQPAPWLINLSRRETINVEALKEEDSDLMTTDLDPWAYSQVLVADKK